MFLFGLMDVPILCGLAWLGLDNRRDEAVLVFEIINNSTFEKTGPTTYIQPSCFLARLDIH